MKRIRPLSKRDRLVLLVTALVGVAATGAVIVVEQSAGWRAYQSEFRAIVAEKMGPEEAARVPQGIQQVWIEELDRVDRCTTCHQGLFWTGLGEVGQPWESHPARELLEAHPLKDFGCTICHGGQGYALSEYAAHGFVRHWEEPLMSRIIASEYDPVNPPPLHEVQCNYCHRYERSTGGMEYINRAKELVRNKGCRICHVINGQGGNLGPDLTFEGDKHAEEFDFSNLATDQLTVFNWHFKHFKSPTNVVPASIMPDLNLQTRDALALTMLAMSWRDDEHLDRRYFPGFELREERTPEEIEADRKMREGDGAFFVEQSCFVCHGIEAFGIESPTNKGPDLSWAPEDVRTRFNKTVEEFLFEPTGTMKIILESQIILTDEQKWEAVNKIMKAYDIVKNREAEAPR